MEISNPRRILAVSLAGSTQHLSKVIKDLTGTHPEPASTSLAGTTHTLSLKTPYYTASVPIWLDLIASPSEWAASFLSPEAKEVLTALGGIAVVFELPTGSGDSGTTRDLLREVGKVVREGLGGWEWDGVGLAVGVGEGESEEWEDVCTDYGLEFVQVKGGKGGEDKNEFGEKTGIPRVLEALEANDWAQETGSIPGTSDFGDFEDPDPTANAKAAGREAGDDEFDPESLDFGFDAEDFEGLRKAIWDVERQGDGDGNDDKLGEEEVEKLEGMMRKLQAVRDLSAGLPEEQRRRMAKRAVGEVMKDL